MKNIYEIYSSGFELISEKYVLIQAGTNPDRWIEATLFIILDGNCLGIMYNKNEWIDQSPVDYKNLLPCRWNHIDVLNMPDGDYIVTYLNGKCSCFSLQAQCTQTDEISKEDNYCISIVATPICDNLYTNIGCDEKCKKIIIFEKDYKKQYYDLTSKTMSCLYDGIFGINADIVACYQNYKVQCFNISQGITLPILENFDILYKCEYLDGSVFLIYNHNADDPMPQEYLLFYSESLSCFYKTEIYKKINIFGITSTIFPFEMSGFEGITESRDVTYRAFGNHWSDNDIKRIDTIQLC